MHATETFRAPQVAMSVTTENSWEKKKKKKHIYIFMQTDDFDRLRISLIAHGDCEER